MSGHGSTSVTMLTQAAEASAETRAGRWARARGVIREALVNFFKEDSLTISASIAYHSLLAIFPLLVLLLGVAGIFIRHSQLAGQLSLVLQGSLPVRPDFLMRNLVGISRAYGRIGLVSFLLLLWSSAGVFLPLEKAFNRAWEVKQGRSWWRSHLLAVEMALALGLVLLISSALMAVNGYLYIALKHWVTKPALPLAEFAYQAVMVGTTFGMTLVMFIILFERLPTCPLRFRQVLPSALLSALFWEAARSLFTLLLPFFNYRHVYGSIGAMVALMTWAYISSAVMLFGAQVSSSLYRTLKVPSTSVIPMAPGVESPAGAR